ncbi:MAG: glycosyltransferase family 2 protein [Bacteroidaceae bacterium]|nr:glycosyltransferase family 2 protein [Bacteroidaceae bacterium]
MNEEILLSIIVPCYNVPLPQLRQCLDSLEFLDKVVTHEVWIIDDGSTKDEVVAYIESRHNPHLHALRQENMGCGGARNTGIEHSRGEYVTFVDADDFIYYGPYIELLKILREKQPDILAQGYSMRYEGAATNFMMNYDIHPSACSYFIHRSLLTKLRFTPHIYHEDEEFSTKLHLLRAHLITVPFSAYFYRYESTSITHNTERTHVLKRFEDFRTILHGLQSLDVPSPHDLALQRRLDIMAMCYILTLLRDSASRADTLFALKKLAELRLYPLPLRWRGLRYAAVALTTRIPTVAHLLSPLVKLLFKIQDASAEKRAFAAHAYLVNADEPEV